MEAGAKIDLLRLMGLDSEAAGAEIDLWLKQSVDDIVRRISDARTTLEAERLEALRETYEEVAARRLAKLDEPDLAHRTASLREIALSAQGKLPGQQGKEQARENAAKETAKNTARAVTVLERIERKAGATYQ